MTERSESHPTCIKMPVEQFLKRDKALHHYVPVRAHNCSNHSLRGARGLLLLSIRSFSGNLIPNKISGLTIHLTMTMDYGSNSLS